MAVLQKMYLLWYNSNISKWDDFNMIIEHFETTQFVTHEIDL